jgi:hypothetical protein
VRLQFVVHQINHSTNLFQEFEETPRYIFDIVILGREKLQLGQTDEAG